MLKRTCSIIFIFFLLLSHAIPIHATSITVTADGLNVRSGPGLDYPIIGKVNSGEEFSVLQQEGEWIKITYNNEAGWVNKQYVTIAGPKENNSSPPLSSITAELDNIHIRSGPSTESDIIYFAKKGESFQVLSETEEWYEIANENVHGFVYKPFVTNKEHREMQLSDIGIVIDAGHGGHDVGAIGATGSYEKDFTFATALKLKEKLASVGATVYMTRERDEFISLASRVNYANMTDADVFLSIHYNSFAEQPDVIGIETFYYQEQNKMLAQMIQEEIIKETGDKDRGITFGDFYVLRQTMKPALLIELGFLSNIETEENLKMDWYQQKIVNGILKGLQKYFSAF